jgi:purine-binding chemotaxis protein CheW
MEAVVEKKETSDIEGKFLTFVLGEEIYGIEILKASEIIGLMDITTVPQTPDYMKGVINLRGKVIPVIDLRKKFSMQEEVHTQETCVIVVEVNGSSIGLIVDSVSEVSDITGLGKVKDKIIILLDIDAVLSTEELEMVEELAEE